MNIEKTVSELVIEFGKIVPEKEADLIELYREYLKRLIEGAKYSSLSISDEDMEKLFRYEFKKFKEMSIEEIRNTLTVDESFEKIQNFSRETFRIARKVLDGEKATYRTIIELKRDAKRIQKEIEKVREDNLREAERLLSEALLDVRYIEDPSVGLTSLRIWHEKQYYLMLSKKR